MKWYPITTIKRPDLSPVFGRLERDVQDRVFRHLLVALERVLALRSALAERTGSAWVHGLQLQVIQQSGQASICAWVETVPDSAFGLTFYAQLHPRNFYDDDPAAGTLGWRPTRRVMATDAWDQEGLVYIYPEKEHRWDPHQELAVELPEQRYRDPEDAAAGFAALWSEMTELASERPLDAASWPPLER